MATKIIKTNKILILCEKSKEEYMYQFILQEEKQGSAWMMALYKDGKNIKYWSCDEHDYDSVWDYINIIKENHQLEEIIIRYEDWKNAFDIDICYLTQDEIKDLRQLV